MTSARTDDDPDAGTAPYDVAGWTSVGGRTENQDRFTVGQGLAILSDGMGGYVGGGVAAGISVAATHRVLERRSSEDVESLLIEAFNAANDEVRAARETDQELARMGATLLVAVFDPTPEQPRRWFIAHVGDSPGILVTPDNHYAVTYDHTIPGELLRQGAITEEEAANHERRNMLLKAIGPEASADPEIREIELRSGEMLVLASDGLNAVVNDEEAAAIARQHPTASAVAQALVNEAVARHTTDNVTVAVVRAP